LISDYLGSRTEGKGYIRNRPHPYQKAFVSAVLDLAIKPDLHLATVYIAMSDKEARLQATAGDEDSFPPPIPKDDPVSLYTTHGPIVLTRHQADGTDQERFNTVTVEYFDDQDPAVSVGGTSGRRAGSHGLSKKGTEGVKYLDTTVFPTTEPEPSHPGTKSSTKSIRSRSSAERSRKAPSIVQQTDAEEQPLSAEGTHHRRRRRRSSLYPSVTQTNHTTRQYHSPGQKEDKRATQTWGEAGIGFFRQMAGQVFSGDHSVQSTSRLVSYWAPEALKDVRKTRRRKHK
jgi:hypothetical protein